MTLSWAALLAEAAGRLGAPIEARWIVERASGWTGADHHLHLDEPVPARALAHFEAMVDRRASGEPLQYVVGAWGFRTLDLLVDRRVLIPRPETETVVEAALGELRGRARTGGGVVVDLGTGSGAIALSLAVEARPAEVWATDASAEALAVARANLVGLGGLAATGVRLVEGDWFAALPVELAGRIDVIVSNPPYVAEGEVAALPPEVAEWEPRGALVAGPGGLEQVQVIVTGAPRWLAPHGSLVVEVAPHQAAAASALARAAGFADIDIRPDLAGRLRTLVARR
ncbi:MAG: peptide chain release factor N(5)-glutamine methyltransferase [Acidimicrobiales bacterium]